MSCTTWSTLFDFFLSICCIDYFLFDILDQLPTEDPLTYRRSKRILLCFWKNHLASSCIWPDQTCCGDGRDESRTCWPHLRLLDATVCDAVLAGGRLPMLKSGLPSRHARHCGSRTPAKNSGSPSSSATQRSKCNAVVWKSGSAWMLGLQQLRPRPISIFHDDGISLKCRRRDGAVPGAGAGSPEPAVDPSLLLAALAIPWTSPRRSHTCERARARVHS
jgi:hypothetical protein